MKNLLIVMITCVLYGCSSVVSIFGDTSLLWTEGMDIKKVETPEGFTVTPQEVHKFSFLRGHGWSIYADNENYYISSADLRDFYWLGDNPYFAKSNGIKIGGRNRKLILGLSQINPFSSFSISGIRELIKKLE